MVKMRKCAHAAARSVAIPRDGHGVSLFLNSIAAD
ncbi:MAG: hypothetical protein RL367_2278 [Pseudomonadota bacterium]